MAQISIAGKAVNPAAVSPAIAAWLEAHVSEYTNRPLKFVQDWFAWEDGEGPDTWQEEFLRDLETKLNSRTFNGKDPVDPIRMARASGNGVGKLQPKSLWLDTPAGRRQWGDIHVGDYLFGADGSPVEVKQRHENGIQAIYRVTLDDGSSTLVGDDHLWTVRGHQQRRKDYAGSAGHNAWITITTKEISNRGVLRKNGNGGAYRQWEIPVQGPAQFPKQEVPIHPYLMGIWLGDPELADRLRGFGYRLTDRDNGKTKHILGIKHLMTDPVFKCGSPTRYIPEPYKYNDIDSRIELLRGLLDTDGEVNGPGSIGYSTTSRQLADDVIWLVRSIGGKAMLQPTTKHGWYPDEHGERVHCRDCHRITINLDFNPFTLEYRKSRHKLSEQRYRTRWIDSIEFSHYEDSMCVTVNQTDGLYLTNDFIVTHNSCCMSLITWWLLITRSHSKGTITANTWTQLDTKTRPEIEKWYGRLRGCKDWFLIQERGIYHKQHYATWFCSIQPWDESNPEAFAGQHNRESTNFIIFDEGSAVADVIWEFADKAMRDGEPFFFAYGNPTRNKGKFYEICFGGERAAWDSKSIDARTSRFPNQSEIQRDIEKYGLDSDEIKVHVLGLPPSQSEDQLIPRATVEGAQQRQISPLPTDPLIAGVDVPDGGSAWFVVRFRRGLSARPGPLVPEPIRVAGSKITREQMIARLAMVLTDRDPCRRVSAMFVDKAFGSPIVERLHMMEHRNVFEVGFGDDSPEIVLPGKKRRFANQRAYMWNEMKDWLSRGCIDANDKKLLVDLTAPGFHFQRSGDGAMVLESKADMQKRGQPSPDDGDALCCTWAMPVAALDYQVTPMPRSEGNAWGWMGALLICALLPHIGRIIVS